MGPTITGPSPGGGELSVLHIPAATLVCDESSGNVHGGKVCEAVTAKLRRRG